MYILENGENWTQELKNAFKTGITHASIIYNNQDYNEDNFLKEAELNDTRYVPNVGIIGQAVAKMLTIKMVNDETSNLNFENADVQFKIGAEYDGNIYYINYGNFIVNEPPENDDTNGTVKFIAYDYMIKFNEDYQDRVIYPCTLKDLLIDICSQAGVELGSDTFLNQNFIVESNQFEGKQLRDVLQHIAKCAFSWARIGQDNKLYLDFEVKEDVDEIVSIDDYKMDAFKKANEFYGPINKVTYADSDIKGQEESVQDNASIEQNGVKELVIYDNYFAYTIDKRRELIKAGTGIFGFTYIPVQQLELIGLAYLDCTDVIQIQNGQGDYFFTRVFSHVIKYNGILSDKIETIAESETQQTYSNMNNSTFQNSKIEISVDRAKKQIQSVVEEVGTQNQKIAVVTQTVNELNSKISEIADITTSQETNTAKLNFTDINQSEPIRIEIHPVSQSITKLYPMNAYTGAEGVFPNSNTYMSSRILRFTNTKQYVKTEDTYYSGNKKYYSYNDDQYILLVAGIDYTIGEKISGNIYQNYLVDYELPMDLLYYNGVYDEFILDYEGQSCIVNKRITRDDYNELSIVEQRTIEFEFPHIYLTDGDYTVEVLGYNSAYLFTRLMAQNIYTTQFATKAELNSEISQTVSAINLSVSQKLSNYSTTTEMNSAINIKANEISSTVSQKVGKNEIISSINQTAESIKINASRINLSGYVTVSSLSTAGSTTINGSNITTGTINADRISGGTISGDNVNITNLSASSITGGTLSANRISGGTINASTVRLKNVTLGTGSSKIGSFTANTSNLESSTANGNIGIGLNLYGNTPAFYVESANGDNWAVVTSSGGITNGSWRNGSLKKYKKDFEKLNNGLNIIQAIDIYKYRLKSENGSCKKRIGLIIDENFKYSQEITTNENDAVDLYSFVSVCCKAIQEQQEQIETLKNEIRNLKEGK